MSDFDFLESIKAKYHSKRQYREIEIDIDDIFAIYENDGIDMDDVQGVKRLIDRYGKICSSERLGSLEFCVSAKNELVRIDNKIKDAIPKMRKLTQDKNVRSTPRGARERGELIHALELVIDDIDEQIVARKFYEGGF